MTKDFGRLAVHAAKACAEGTYIGPRAAWATGAIAVFPESQSMRDKGCPRSTFLALCGAGFIKGVPAGIYARPGPNSVHALDAVALIRKSPGANTLEAHPLWGAVTEGSGKAHNGQMHVVLALANADLLDL